jgi:hypothetical protein
MSRGVILRMCTALIDLSLRNQGTIDDGDETESESFDLWFSYWRRMFPEITADSIRAFEVLMSCRRSQRKNSNGADPPSPLLHHTHTLMQASYRGSTEERSDILQAYQGTEQCCCFPSSPPATPAPIVLTRSPQTLMARWM